jgi:hypothetical protein
LNFLNLNSKEANLKDIIDVKKLNDGFELLNEINNEIINNKGRTFTSLIFCDEMINFMNGLEAFSNFY